VERNLIGIPVHAEGVVPACRMQEEDMQSGHSRDEKGDEEVESEKASQSRVVHGEPPPEPGH